MADNFDAVEIIYDIIKTCGVDCYKDKAPRDLEGEYVVIGSSACNHGEIVNIPQVNVNIFVPRPSNGMVNRARIKTLRTAIYDLIKASEGPSGYYCYIDRSFSALIEDVRDGYDCFTIRLELTLNT